VDPKTRPDERTVAAERAEMDEPAGPDEEPTSDEEAAAQRAEPLDPDVAEHYEEMAERGAKQRGEGRIE
jgi:hypothetical protein